MRNIHFIISLALVLFSCGDANNTRTVVKTDPSVSPNTYSPAAGKIKPLDSLIAKYISASRNKLVGLSRDQEEWIFDRTEKTDTADYLVYQIGHDVTDEGNTNPRFVTDQWIYIDSLNNRIYEYDLPNDSLIEWLK
jgi:hypothetical protein